MPQDKIRLFKDLILLVLLRIPRGSLKGMFIFRDPRRVDDIVLQRSCEVSDTKL
jgi:hypothetical protein